MKWEKKNPSSSRCHCLTNSQQTTGVSFSTEQARSLARTPSGKLSATAIRCWLGLWSPEDTGADSMFLAYIFKMLTITVVGTRDFGGLARLSLTASTRVFFSPRRDVLTGN